MCGRRVSPAASGMLVALLPVLFMLAWWGGWWLIPADLAWLVLVLLAGPHGESPSDAVRTPLTDEASVDAWINGTHGEMASETTTAQYFRVEASAP